jgi:hypothetical protein
MIDADKRLMAAKYVLSMLERLSADSAWAHQASGLRGSILHAIDRMENDPDPEKHFAELERLERLVDEGYAILKLAARAIPEDREKK